MSRVIAVVEGPTEETFVRIVLAPWLALRGVFLSARTVGKPGKKGGVGVFDRAKRDVEILLRQEKSTVVTTMFDYYGMPTDWPGRDNPKKVNPTVHVKTVEKAIGDAVSAAIGPKFDGSRFLPYIQLHEFEALVLVGPEELAAVGPWPEKLKQLRELVRKYKTPELVNDGPLTVPSKRLEKLLPGYRKPLHGPRASQKIGIERIAAKCPHFAGWLAALLAVPQKPPQTDTENGPQGPEPTLGD